MAEEMPPLTDPLFATEDESNITDNIDDQGFPTPTDPPPPVVQEEARPCQQTDQLELSTPHMPRWRMDEGEMLCALLAPSPINMAPNTQHLLPLTLMRERRRVLLEDMLPLPSQATTHQGGGLDLLVCPPLPREGGAGRWLYREEMVCGTVLQSLTSYEEGSEVVCGDVWWRLAQSTPYQTSDTTALNSEAGTNLGTINTYHYLLQQLLQLPTELMIALNYPVAFNSNFSCICVIDEVEDMPNNKLPIEAEGNPPTHTATRVRKDDLKVYTQN